ncbi:16S rRNA-processing protein RimM [Bacteroidales bacterium Barb6XT]|nr:16S rRNA-processing protein RimM [Bacteroidales bacterium Barb6XT]
MIREEEVNKIGRFGKPHGVKGEIPLFTASDVFDDEAACPPYIVCCMDGILVPFFIEEYRRKGNTAVLLKLEYIDSEEAAKELSNRDVYYPADEAGGNHPADGMTWDSLTGYIVSDRASGLLGKITDVDDTTLNVLLRIDYNGKELLFPAAEELILSIDHTNRQMTISLPDGLTGL